MAFNLPLFGFGILITVLVGIGVLLSIVEFRQQNRPPLSDNGHDRRP